jgi:protein-tyrosine-phosphatase
MAASEKKRVVFVCVENSCRSQMAEALTRMIAPDTIAAYSAGSRPSGQVNPKAVASLAELGYDLTAHTSKGLNDLPAGEYAAAVTMGCGDECPTVQARQRVDWGIPDPKHLPPEDFRKIRDVIAMKVRELVASLEA